MKKKAIFAAFHSSSDGYTESAENVFTHELPYLQSVFSPENAETVPNYDTAVSISFTDFRTTVFDSFPSAVFGVDPSGWITDVRRSLGGRIISLKVGGAEMSGTQFRFLFSLRSASIEIGQTAEGFTFSVTGYGHGVGMSQYGANLLAAGGSSFEEILTWYYTGVELSDMLDIYALPSES